VNTIHSHLTDEEPDGQRGYELPKNTQPANVEAANCPVSNLGRKTIVILEEGVCRLDSQGKF
jgi:hypothetical protein